jgi:LysM repeat protein
VATAEPTLTPAATAAAKTDVEHLVVQGESLLSIARRYNTTVTAIMNRNGLVNQNTIYAGTKLVIPVGYIAEETPPTGTIQHVVVAGETLSQLARTYRTSVASIKAQNPAVTADPDHVKPGTTLTIAVGSAPQVRTHTVRGGESLSAIARRYQVSVTALTQANGLRNPNQVIAGQVLVIP